MSVWEAEDSSVCICLCVREKIFDVFVCMACGQWVCVCLGVCAHVQVWRVRCAMLLCFLGSFSGEQCFSTHFSLSPPLGDFVDIFLPNHPLSEIVIPQTHCISVYVTEYRSMLHIEKE